MTMLEGARVVVGRGVASTARVSGGIVTVRIVRVTAELRNGANQRKQAPIK
jgi:hypothetical protein